MNAKGQEIKDFVFLLGLGLVGAGASSVALRQIPFFKGAFPGDPMNNKRRQIAQVIAGFAGALLLPKKGIPGLLKLASVGMAFSGGFGLAQNMGAVMLSGRRSTSTLTRDQLLFLQTGRAPMNGPQTMRSMSGPQTMRPMSGAGTQPSLMGRAGTPPGMMGRSGSAFRASF
jgi:hypothetical protein